MLRHDAGRIRTGTAHMRGIKVKGLEMNGMKLLATAAALLVASSATAQAHSHDNHTGAYVGASGLVSTLGDVDFDNDAANANTRTASFDVGGGVLLRAGYDLGSFRAELEAGARVFDLDGIDGVTNESGDANFYTAMINGAYDFDTGTAITPYASLGVGAAFAEGNITYTSSGGEVISKDYFGVAPAGQVGVGAAYTLSDDVDLVGGYSFLAAPTDETNEDQVIQVHSIQLGLNYNF